MATHRAIDAARKRKTHAETSLEETDEPTVFERVHDSFFSSYLQRMVATLPEKQRSVMVLRYQEEMELEEIAKVLDMKVSTVKTQISRALELLRGRVSRRLGKGKRTMTPFEETQTSAAKTRAVCRFYCAGSGALRGGTESKAHGGFWRLSLAAAAALLMAAGGTVYQRHEHEAKGLAAKRQLLLAMRIAGTKLQEVQQRVKESEQIEQ